MQLTLAPGRSSSPNLMAACSFVIWKKNHKSLIINLFFFLILNHHNFCCMYYEIKEQMISHNNLFHD